MFKHLNKWFVLGFVVVVAVLASTVLIAIGDDGLGIDAFQEDTNTSSTAQTVIAREATAATSNLGESRVPDASLIPDPIIQPAYQGNIGPILDVLDLDGITKVMIVAHPDDETLWGGAHLYEGGWLVVCLSNQTTLGGVRSAEFSSAMESLGAVGIVLDYPDKGAWDDALTTANIKEDVTTLLEYRGIQWEQVATHNPNGEYGHSHHRATSGIVTSVYDAVFPGEDSLYYFGRYYSQESIDALQPLVRIDSRDAVIKDHVLNNIYISQNLSAHTQMFPFENWVKRSSWDNDGVHSVTEIYGDTRIETAVAVAKEAYPNGSQGVIIASGYSFPDALMASSLAGMLGYPILLTNPTAPDPSVEDEIVALGAEKALIIGGAGVVDTGVEAALKTILGMMDVERLSGKNRYETSFVFADWRVDQGYLVWDGAGFATGIDYPDALAGGVLQGTKDSVLLLASSAIGLEDTTMQVVPLLHNLEPDQVASMKNVYFFGGFGAFRPALRRAILASLIWRI